MSRPRPFIGSVDAGISALGFEEEDARRSAELDALLMKTCARCGKRAWMEQALCMSCRRVPRNAVPTPKVTNG